MAYTIGKYSFRTKKDIITSCSKILHKKPIGSVIDVQDEEFVRNIFRLRKDKVAELASREVVRFLVKMHRHNTPSFFAELSDGSFMDFSFNKAVKALPVKRS